MTSPSLQYVIRDTQAVGFILSAGPKGFRAFNADGLSLGLYADQELAAKAVYAEASRLSVSSAPSS